ncbi:MAG: cell filamentation protein Fic [Betaproteobacteria bacterium RBG_16_58_11]|nr:MAG: cell filamentation protein Fic [Betaproteobacteria bacterium RBG_16_58_11]OFZ97186.1 MAG: cell filamentation protein Fic [Betaproteobacteria bacterium RBG_19FT_COMBO_58_11]
MPKKLPEDLNLMIATEIARHRAGIGIDDLHSALADIVSRRTLQRRLGELAEQKHISAMGQGKARMYRALGTVDIYATHAETGEPGEETRFEIYVPISSDGREILDYLRQPIQLRKPVGYDRSFLEAYRPNETFYLAPEIREHLHHIGRSPDGERPAGTYARDILARLLIDLSWASSRLEGNTYTRLDTQNLIELGQAAEGKNRREAQMILNHKAAIELLVEQAEDIGFNAFTFFNLHALLSDNLLADPAESGRLRARIVEVSGTVFHPLGIPQQIDHYFHMILAKADAIDDPLEQAFFIMVHIPYLQPFVDVNKRVSRLGANIPLIRRNLCPLSFIDVPERAYVEGTLGVYELKQVDLLRDVFVWAYERSCQRYMAIRETIAEPDPVRLRHREALIALVAEIVHGQQVPSEAAVRTVAATLVPQEDLERVIELALDDLRNLHEGNVSRYRLRLSEYRAWRPMQQAGMP